MLQIDSAIRRYQLIKILDCPSDGDEFFVPSKESEGFENFAGVGGKLGPSLPKKQE